MQRCWFVKAYKMLVLLAAGMLCMASAYASQITLQDKATGKTPLYMGENIGNASGQEATASNQEWYKNSGMNSCRLWIQMNNYEPKNDNEPYGNGVTDEASFEKAKAEVIANPEHNKYINWDAFKYNIRRMNLDKNSQAYVRCNLVPIINLRHHTDASFWVPVILSKWSDRWEWWEYCFAISYYLNKTYGFTEYELLNEPNIKNSGIPLAKATPHDVLIMVQFGADGVASAAKATNAQDKVNIYAPTLGTSDYQGLDILAEVLSGKGTNGKQGDFYFNGISYHSYRPPEADMIKQFSEVQKCAEENNPDGDFEPFVLTEYDVQLKNFKAEPAISSVRLARQIIQYIPQGQTEHSWLKCMLKFRLIASAEASDDTTLRISKESTPEFEGENLLYFAHRVLQDATKGAKEVIAAQSDLKNDEYLVSRDENNYYLIAVNPEKDKKRELMINASATGITDSPVFARLINQKNRGTVSELKLAKGNLQYSMDPESLIYMKIPRHYQEKEIKSLEIAPAGPINTHIYGAKNLAAMAHYADGTTEDISERVAWESSDPKSVKMLATGLALAISAQGESTLSATYHNMKSNEVKCVINQPKPKPQPVPGTQPNSGAAVASRAAATQASSRP